MSIIRPKTIKTAIAFAVAIAGLGAASTPASAESTYWQDRWRNYESTPEAKYFNRRDAYRAHADVRVSKRARYAERRYYVERDYDGPRPRGYNGPVTQSQEKVQQSVYDFATGGSGAIDKFR